MFPNVIDMYHGDNREHVPNFAALADIGIWGIFHKATQGTSYVDPKFSDRIASAKSAGLLVGAYHFIDASDPIAQVDHFLSVASDHGIALCVDYEKTQATDQAALHQVQDFMAEVEKRTRVSVMLYSGALIRQTLQPHVGGHLDSGMIGAIDFFRVHRLWLAEYGPHENIPYPWDSKGEAEVIKPWLWQFKSSGHMPAIIGDTDLNYYAGTRDQLVEEWMYGPSDVATSRENSLGRRGVTN